jgi:hypothetical protein
MTQMAGIIIMDLFLPYCANKNVSHEWYYFETDVTDMVMSVDPKGYCNVYQNDKPNKHLFRFYVKAPKGSYCVNEEHQRLIIDHLALFNMTISGRWFEHQNGVEIYIKHA